MKAFVITLAEVPDSVQAAERCIASGRKFGLSIEKLPAVWKDRAEDARAFHGLRAGNLGEPHSDPRAALGCFLSHYEAWLRVLADGPAIIMEHDAVVVAPIPQLQGRFVNLGKPSFGRVREAPRSGLQAFFSRPNKMAGAHAYYVEPLGAEQLVEAARRDGITPTDLFINPRRFDFMLEYHPWPIECQDSFTTIQKAAHCRSKHGWRPGYRIL